MVMVNWKDYLKNKNRQSPYSKSPDNYKKDCQGFLLVSIPVLINKLFTNTT